MDNRRYTFTSEAVAVGHPDKVCDQVSDAVLDACLAQDPYSRVACECLVKNDLLMLAGEITTRAQFDMAEVARCTLREIGYTDAQTGMDADTCEVLVKLEPQSPDIAMGVNEDKGSGKRMGAGDQGMMMGFACNDTPELMPMPIQLAHRMMGRLEQLRTSGTLTYLRPDGKCQVTVQYDGLRPVGVHTVVLSTHHSRDVAREKLRSDMIEAVILPSLPEEFRSDDINFLVNPTGQFIVGGPQGDCGLTGRKIIVDTYGGRARHGGGAFSGKDPTKVDRSASYAVRYVAKNVVAAGLADVCEVYVSYAIGEPDPVAVNLDTEGTAKIDEDRICEIIKECFDLSVGGIIESLDLRRPIYKETAKHGHFGHDGPNFTWERTDKAALMRSIAGL